MVPRSIPNELATASGPGVGGATLHHGLPDDRRQGDDYSDAAGGAPEPFGDARDLRGGIARREEADDDGGADEREKRVQPQQDDRSDDGGHPDEEQEDWR